MKIQFQSQEEKDRVCQIFEKLRLAAQNGEVLSGAQEGAIPGFDEFWAVCPNKADKKRSKRLWEALSKAKKEKCFLGMKNYQKQCSQDGRTNILMPSTFINNERWEDLGIDVRAPAYEGKYANKVTLDPQKTARKPPKKPEEAYEPVSEEKAKEYVSEIARLMTPRSIDEALKD